MSFHLKDLYKKSQKGFLINNKHNIYNILRFRLYYKINEQIPKPNKNSNEVKDNYIRLYFAFTIYRGSAAS